MRILSGKHTKRYIHVLARVLKASRLHTQRIGDSEICSSRADHSPYARFIPRINLYIPSIIQLISWRKAIWELRQPLIPMLLTFRLVVLAFTSTH
jgi:hypothetical protein